MMSLRRNRTLLRTSCRVRGQSQRHPTVSSRPRTSSRTPVLVDSVEQERVQKVLLEVHNLDDRMEEKDADFSTD